MRCVKYEAVSAIGTACNQSNQLLEELPVPLRALGRTAYHLGHHCSCYRQLLCLLGSCSQSWTASMEKDTESQSKENARYNYFQAFNRQVRKYLRDVYSSALYVLFLVIFYGILNLQFRFIKRKAVCTYVSAWQGDVYMRKERMGKKNISWTLLVVGYMYLAFIHIELTLLVPESGQKHNQSFS